MARKIYRLPPCPDYDVERLESWLQDMAMEGLVLEPESEIFGLFGFTPAAPRRLRYRLQPKAAGNNDLVPDSEVRNMAAEFGWEFVDSYRNFHIYRTADPNAREMDTDLEVQAAALKTVKQSFASQLLSEFFSVFTVLFIVKRAGPFRFLVSFPPIYPLVLLLLPVGCLISVVLRVRHVHRLQKQLKCHIPLDHSKPWKPAVRLQRIRRIVSLGLLILAVAVIFNACSQWINNQDLHLSQYPGTPPFVTLSDIAEEYQPQNLFDFYNTYEFISTPLASTVLDWREYADIRTPDGKLYNGSVLIVNYYEVASPWLAQQLAEELLRTAQKEKHYSQLEVPDVGTDFCAAYTKIWPTILLRQGNTVIEASVHITNAAGDSFFPEWTALQASRMKGGQ